MNSENRTAVEQKGLIGWFVGNHVAANLLLMFFVAGGLLAVWNMRTELFPTIDPRLITIQVPYPGSTPHEVEDGITRRVEEAVIGVEGVKEVTSVAQEGLGVVTIEVEQFADTDDVLDDVETAVDQLIDFPPQEAEEPVIVKIKPQPSVITLVLYGNIPELTLKRWAERLEDEMLRTAGISLVQVQGAREYEISIEISEEDLRKYDLSIEQVGRAVAASAIDFPAGTVETEAGDVLLRIQEKGYVGKAFEDIVILSRPDGSLLRLNDIAEIVDGFRDDNLITRYKGEPAVFIEVFRSESQDTLRVEQAVNKYLSRLRLPAGLQIAILENQTQILKQRMNLLARNAILGFVLVFLVLLLFLDLKLAFWTSLGIPISFFGGLLIVFIGGLSFNMITLFALIVVLGIVVDDAIVTGESIFSEQEAGRKDADAALRGVSAIRAPVTVGVLTTMAAFAPLAFTTGVLGQVMRPIPIFVISILLVSLIEAFTILPAHLSSSARWSRGAVSGISRNFNMLLDRFVDRIVIPVLRRAVRWRYAVLALFAALLILLMGMVRGDIIRFIFFPQIEGDEVTAKLIMPVGTPFEVTRRNALRMMEAARHIGEELSRREDRNLFEGTAIIIGATFAESGPGAAGAVQATTGNRAEVLIKLIDAPLRTVSAQEVENRLKATIGDIPNADELTFESSIITGGADLNIQLSHDDTAVLNAAADLMKHRMQTMDGVEEIADSLKAGKLEYVFELTPQGLAAGLSPAELGRQLRNAFFGYEVQRIQRARSELKVMVRYPKERREQIRDIYNFRVTLPDGEKAPLEVMARIKQQRAYAEIRRVNGQRVVNITADVDQRTTTPGDALAVVMEKIVPEIKERYPGVEAEVTGESEDRREDLASLFQNMSIALLIIFVMLGAQLRSYIQPFIIMAIIPFGMIGAVLGHLLLGFDLSFVSVFGMVALTGVVINDSVILVDYFNKERKKKEKDEAEAVFDAVRRRFRPILLTTMTTSFALLPMLLETSLQARFLIPMAISLAFGLLFASFLLPFLLPVLISISGDISKGLRIRKH
ncbi:MAG: efflux RND transporter permease subunit [Syntrophales bacterium]|jgi:multidrug efflux pump subunit AcrB|nr:efflux RND transporter permease subunit [Syntrophales bacterium]